VIENIQRDVNIALINELAMLFKGAGARKARSARGARGWWAATASASIRIISRTKPNRLASIRR
jgi:hypothetical protein